MEFKKNQEIIVTIDDLGNNGEGIGHIDGYALFVKDALPGETVRVKLIKCKKNYGYAKLLEILPSPVSDVGRVQPRCPVARQCGGCTLQHLSYEKQLLYKERKVYNCLKRIGGVEFGEEVQQLPIIGMDEPWHYRNKAQFPVRMYKSEDGTYRPVVGFYVGRTHCVVPVTDCAIQDRCMKQITESVLSWMEENKIPAYDEKTLSGIVRHIYIRRAFCTGEIMVCLVINKKKLKQDLSRRLIERLSAIHGVAGIFLNSNTKDTNVILGNDMTLLWGKNYIEDRIGDIRYRISPKSFFQVNPVQTVKLYETALQFADLSGSETVWDLYCGIGTISLFLAKRAKQVYGVEIVPEAVESARQNAHLNNIDNVEFFCGAAEDVVPRWMAEDAAVGTEDSEREGTLATTFRADVVVVDPPRKGCDQTLLKTITQMSPEKIVYVSCDPATLARDVKVLGEDGYVLRRVRACDMFPQGGHVETVCVLGNKNRKPDDYLKVNIDVDKIHDILDKEKAEKEAKEKSQSE